MFKELFESDLENGIKKILKNKASDKTVFYGNSLYFRIDTIKSAIRIKKSVEDLLFDSGEVEKISGGAGDHTSRTILDYEGVLDGGRIVVVFKNKIPQSIIELTKATKFKGK